MQNIGLLSLRGDLDESFLFTDYFNGPDRDFE